MSPKPAVLRCAASRDIDEALAFYFGREAYDAAHRWVDGLEAAFAHLSHYPETGSPRYAEELDLPGLRYWPLPGYPYLVFYVERDDHLDVWRVLHAERDIPKWLDPGT